MKEPQQRTRGGRPRAALHTLCRECRKRVVTSRFAIAAGVGADTTVLMVARVPFTLVTACSARLGARLQNRAGELRFEFSLSAEDPTCGVANVAAIEAECARPVKAVGLPESH